MLATGPDETSQTEACGSAAQRWDLLDHVSTHWLAA